MRHSRSPLFTPSCHCNSSVELPIVVGFAQNSIVHPCPAPTFRLADAGTRTYALPLTLKAWFTSPAAYARLPPNTPSLCPATSLADSSPGHQDTSPAGSSTLQ